MLLRSIHAPAFSLLCCSLSIQPALNFVLPTCYSHFLLCTSYYSSPDVFFFTSHFFSSHPHHCSLLFASFLSLLIYTFSFLLVSSLLPHLFLQSFLYILLYFPFHLVLNSLLFFPYFLLLFSFICTLSSLVKRSQSRLPSFHCFCGYPLLIYHVLDSFLHPVYPPPHLVYF